MDCPNCEQPNPEGSRFCNSCGQALTAELDPGRAPQEYTPNHLAEKIRASRRSLEGERKQVTVMFADVMGSMDLSEQTDPEQWRRIMDRFVNILCDGVHRFEGTVDKFTGDGIMALFGAPIAHEDHAQRACYAALHLQGELAEYAGELRRSQGLNFSVRMGLNSGEVVVGSVGEDLRLDYTAVGHTVGLAQRMETLAEPGKVYLTDHTASLVSGFFRLEDLGEFDVKGSREALRVYELAGIGAAKTRLDVARARGLSRFVGRTDEMAKLEAALARAQEGEGSVIGIVGEAGVGKSRLFHEFAERCRTRGLSVYIAGGRAHTKDVPLLPVLDFLRDYFGISDQETDRAARDKIAGRLLLFDEEIREDLPLVFDLLGVPDPERPAPRMSPEARQRRLFALIKRIVQAASEHDPGVNMLEDLHWIDPGSELFLAQLIESIPGTRNFTIVNFRPEYKADWMSKPYYQQISLVPLGPEAAEELLIDLLGTDPSLNGAAELIRERSGGNPFFIEEIVQTLAEGGQLAGQRGAYRMAKPLEDAALPATVQAVLAARIDRLPEDDKAVLQAASVIGREFQAPILARAVELTGDELDQALRELVAGEFIYEQAVYPETEYAFKHPLTQEVAYGSQLAERREAVHAAVAQALEELNPDRLDELAGLIAQHWEEADKPIQAARWHARAAGWAGFNDPAEAVRHWRRVRELAESLPESPETVALGITSRTLILQFAWRLGIPEQEAESLFEEGKALAEEAGDKAGLSFLYAAYGQTGTTGDSAFFVDLALESVRLAEETGDKALQMVVRPGIVYALFIAGRLRESLAEAEKMIELGEADPTLGAGVAVGNPYGWALMFRGYLLAIMGRLEESRRSLDHGLQVLREQGDIESSGWAHMMYCNHGRYKGDYDSAMSHARQSVEIAERIGDSFSRAWAHTFMGFAHSNLEEWDEARAASERALEISRQTRTALEGESLRLGNLALALLGQGDTERAPQVAREALEYARERGQIGAELTESFYVAQILMATDGPTDEVDAIIDRALDLTRETGARGDEPLLRLRAAEFARLAGDEAGREHELREAKRLFEQNGATGHLAELEEQLAAAAG
jgi:class 3 adenylate cyclase/tetratricopeptide (TPR) repeat protein